MTTPRDLALAATVALRTDNIGDACPARMERAGRKCGKAQQIGLEKLGRKVDLDESLVSRVARMVFADELTREERKKLTSRIARQSNNRLGGSATRAHNDREPVMAEMERLYRELEGN